jgi:hypothetical protein
MHKLSSRQNRKKKRENRTEYKPSPNRTARHVAEALEVPLDVEASNGYAGNHQIPTPSSSYNLETLISDFELHLREWDGR